MKSLLCFFSCNAIHTPFFQISHSHLHQFLLHSIQVGMTTSWVFWVTYLAPSLLGQVWECTNQGMGGIGFIFYNLNQVQARIGFCNNPPRPIPLPIKPPYKYFSSFSRFYPLLNRRDILFSDSLSHSKPFWSQFFSQKQSSAKITPIAMALKLLTVFISSFYNLPPQSRCAISQSFHGPHSSLHLYVSFFLICFSLNWNFVTLIIIIPNVFFLLVLLFFYGFFSQLPNE